MVNTKVMADKEKDSRIRIKVIRWSLAGIEAQPAL